MKAKPHFTYVDQNKFYTRVGAEIARKFDIGPTVLGKTSKKRLTKKDLEKFYRGIEKTVKSALKSSKV